MEYFAADPRVGGDYCHFQLVCKGPYKIEYFCCPKNFEFDPGAKKT